jgi:hypothetical protein
VNANEVVELLTENETGTLLPEFTIGAARIDLVAIDEESIRGYEVKASTDRVNDRRFHHQLHFYTQSMEYLTYVVHQKFLEHCLEALPDWVGITVIEDDDTLTVYRPALPNPNINCELLSRMLWKDEATAGIKQIELFYKNKFTCPWCRWGKGGQHDRVSSKCTKALSHMLKDALSEDEFKIFIRRAIINRKWTSMAGKERRVTRK